MLLTGKDPLKPSRTDLAAYAARDLVLLFVAMNTRLPSIRRNAPLAYWADGKAMNQLEEMLHSLGRSLDGRVRIPKDSCASKTRVGGN